MCRTILSDRSSGLWWAGEDITLDNLKSRVKHVEGAVRGDASTVFAGLAKVAMDTFAGAGLDRLSSDALPNLLRARDRPLPDKLDWISLTSEGSNTMNAALGMTAASAMLQLLLFPQL
jgi:hypothetical protein